MVVLNGSVRLIVLQFSFSNPGVIPQAVKHLDQETEDESIKRRNRSSGVLVIEPTEKCSLMEFLGELEATGYEIVDALYQERINPKSRRMYQMVRFLFARREFADISDKFKKARDDTSAGLSETCRLAMWRVRVYSNPFYKNGKEIPGQRALSVNLDARQPLFRSDGQPVMVWQKNEKGKRLGNAPLPLKPDHYLRIVNDTVQLVTA